MLPKRDPRIDLRLHDELSAGMCLYCIRSVHNDIVRYYLVYPDGVRWTQVLSLLNWRDVAADLTVVGRGDDDDSSRRSTT